MEIKQCRYSFLCEHNDLEQGSKWPSYNFIFFFVFIESEDFILSIQIKLDFD